MADNRTLASLRNSLLPKLMSLYGKGYTLRTIYKYLSFYRQYPDIMPTAGAETFVPCTFTTLLHCIFFLNSTRYLHSEAIRQYWRVFYVNPPKYKGTQLEDMVFDWLKTDGKDIVEDWDNMFRIKD